MPERSARRCGRQPEGPRSLPPDGPGSGPPRRQARPRGRSSVHYSGARALNRCVTAERSRDRRPSTPRNRNSMPRSPGAAHEQTILRRSSRRSAGDHVLPSDRDGPRARGNRALSHIEPDFFRAGNQSLYRHPPAGASRRLLLEMALQESAWLFVPLCSPDGCETDAGPPRDTCHLGRRQTRLNSPLTCAFPRGAGRTRTCDRRIMSPLL